MVQKERETKIKKYGLEKYKLYMKKQKKKMSYLIDSKW